MLEQDQRKLQPGWNCRISSYSPSDLVYWDPFRWNALQYRTLRGSRDSESDPGLAMSSFNSASATADQCNLANSCPQGMGLNISPSVGRFKHAGEAPSVYMRGNVHGPAHHASSYSMAPQSNYGMFKDEPITQHPGQRLSTFESSRSNLGPPGKMNSSTVPKKSM